MFKIIFSREFLYSEEKDAKDLQGRSKFGEKKEGRIQYSLVEGLYLAEKKKARIMDGKGKNMSKENFIRRARRIQPNFWVRYCVFRDLRDRGYIVKTALKFGADFRVYDRGVKPGDDHAKWIVYPVHESEVLTWYEFAAKNRVAHSTRKKLLLGVVDEENDVSYWECSWVKP